MKLSKKNKYLILGTIFMLLLSYRLAIQKTVSAQKEYASNLSQKEAVSYLPEQLSIMVQREKAIDIQLAKMDVGSISAQNNLLKFMNSEATKNSVKVIGFNSPHVAESERGTIETYTLHLEGGYTSILKTLNAMENKGSFGTINHLHFEKKKDYRPSRTYLQAMVFLEHVK